MKIYTTLNIGEFHSNFCEDFLVNEHIGENKLLIAVMDGCTMGTESTFASMLIGKLIRNISKQKYYQEFIVGRSEDIKTDLKDVLRSLMNELKSVKNTLGLETNELLSTLIIGVLDEKQNKAELLTVGDELVYADGQYFEYEQNDKPDYLGYHLSEDFEIWYSDQNQRLSLSSFKDLSICTDGIFTFKNLKETSNQLPEEVILDFFLKDLEGGEYDSFLDRKIRNLSEKEHLVTDDLAIIRVIK